MAADLVEEEGIRRAKSEMQRADRVLYVLDATLGDSKSRGGPCASAAQGPGGVHHEQDRSSRRCAAPGVERRLHAHLFERANRSRHRAAARSFEGKRRLSRRRFRRPVGPPPAPSMRCAAPGNWWRAQPTPLRQSHAIELIAEDLRLAQRNLSEITGDFTSEDLLGEIFGSFLYRKVAQCRRLRLTRLKTRPPRSNPAPGLSALVTAIQVGQSIAFDRSGEPRRHAE